MLKPCRYMAGNFNAPVIHTKSGSDWRLATIFRHNNDAFLEYYSSSRMSFFQKIFRNIRSFPTPSAY